MQFSVDIQNYATWLIQSLPHLLFSLPCLFIASLAGICFPVKEGRFLAREKKRSSYDKGAKQMLSQAVFWGWIALIAGCALFVWHYQDYIPKTCESALVAAAWLLLFLCVFWYSLHLLVWKFLANHLFVHAFLSGLGILIGLAMGAFFWGVTYLLVFATPFPNSGDIVSDIFSLAKHIQIQFSLENMTLQDLLSVGTSGKILTLFCLLPIFICIPVVFASTGILFLRMVHDFGRDHYTIVLTWCSRISWHAGFWIFLFALLHLGFCGYMQYEAQQFALEPLCSDTILVVLWGLANTIWICMSKSALPLRHKVWMLCANFFAILSIGIFLCEWLR